MLWIPVLVTLSAKTVHREARLTRAAWRQPHYESKRPIRNRPSLQAALGNRVCHWSRVPMLLLARCQCGQMSSMHYHCHDTHRTNLWCQAWRLWWHEGLWFGLMSDQQDLPVDGTPYWKQLQTMEHPLERHYNNNSSKAPVGRHGSRHWSLFKGTWIQEKCNRCNESIVL